MDGHFFCARLGHASQEYNGGSGGGAVVLTKNATSVYRSSVPLLSLDLLSFDTTVSTHAYSVQLCIAFSAPDQTTYNTFPLAKKYF